MEKGPNIFLAWLSAHRLTAAAGLFCALLGVLIFWLYGLPGEAIVYLIGLCLVGIAFFGALSFLRFWRKHKTLCTMEEGILMAAESLPDTTTAIEEDYQRLVQRLLRENRQLHAKIDGSMEDLTTYYTLWVHQIKTPIAAMDLLLQAKEEDTSALEVELQRISQYVDMVLQYLRLDSETRDLDLQR